MEEVARGCIACRCCVCSYSISGQIFLVFQTFSNFFYNFIRILHFFTPFNVFSRYFRQFFYLKKEKIQNLADSKTPQIGIFELGPSTLNQGGSTVFLRSILIYMYIFLLFQDCINGNFSKKTYACPDCETDLGSKFKIAENENLASALLKLFPDDGSESSRAD